MAKIDLQCSAKMQGCLNIYIYHGNVSLTTSCCNKMLKLNEKNNQKQLASSYLLLSRNCLRRFSASLWDRTLLSGTCLCNKHPADNHTYIYFYKCRYNRPISVKVPCLPTRSGDNLLHQSRFWRKWPNNCHEHKSCNHDEYAQHWELKTARQTAETVQLLGLCPTPYFQRLWP